MNARPCQKCGMQIEFRIGPNGKQIPLQRVRKIYALDPNGDVSHLTQSLSIAEAEIGEPATTVYFVSHFETCPSASSFSRRNKETR